MSVLKRVSYLLTILSLLIKGQHAVGGRQYITKPLAGKVAVVSGASHGSESNGLCDSALNAWQGCHH